MISTLAGAALATAALAGCGQSAEESSAERIELSFLAFTSPNITKEFWEEAVANVENDFPDVTIELLYPPTLDRQGYAKQLLASGQLPDILWDAPLAEFVEAGALSSFEPSDFEGLNVPDDFNAIDGKQYSLANGVFISPGLYFNEEAFEAAGAEVPQTFDDLVDTAEKLKGAGTTPFLLQSASDPWAAEFLLNALVTADVIAENPDWLAQRHDGEVSFADPDFKGAVDKFVQLRDAELFNADALSLNYAQANTAWATGDYGIWPMGGWAAGVQVDFPASVFPMPTDDGSKVLPTVIGPALYISSQTAHPEVAREVAVALVSQPELQESQLVYDAQFPIVDGITAPADVTPATEAGFELYTDTSYTQVTGFPNSVSGDDAPPSGWTAEYDQAIQGLLGGGTSDEFVATLDQAWDSLQK